MKSILITIIYVLIGQQFIYGQFWEKVITPDTALISSFCVTNEGTILIGTWDDQYHTGGIYRSCDMGITWEFISLTQSGTSIISLSTNYDQYIFAGYDYIYRSSDDGQNWNENYNIAPSVALSFFKNSNSEIFVGIWGGINKSDDFGINWNQVLSLPYDNSIQDFEETSNGNLYATNWNLYNNLENGVFKSDDGGETWNFIDFADDGFTCLAVNSKDEIFASCYSEGLYKSDDYGETWSLIPVNTVNDIYIDSNDLIYKASDYFGVSRSYDNGETWESISSGMGNVAHKFSGAPNGHLYCRGGYSLFRSKEAVLDTGDTIKTPTSFSVYPNPSNGRITFKIPEPESLKNPFIEIFTVYGQQILSIPVCTQLTEFDTRNLPSGTYLYKLRTIEGRSLTKKFIIIK